jgi:signal transduction histidine kinase/DNA-binding response OmpR family regulator
MRERLGLYFLVAVLLPLGFGTLVSEYLILRHINGLAVSNASERLETAVGRLDQSAQRVKAILAELAASRDPLPGGDVLDSGPDSVYRRLGQLDAVRKLDLVWMASPDGRVDPQAPTGPVGSPLLDDALSRLHATRHALRGKPVLSYEELPTAALRSHPRLLGRVRASSAEAGTNLPDRVLMQVVALPLHAGGDVDGALVAATVLNGNDALCGYLVAREPFESVISHRGVWVARSSSKDAATPVLGRTLGPGPLASLTKHQRWVGKESRAEDGVFTAMAPLANAEGEVIGAVGARVGTARLSVLRSDARWSFIVAMGVGAMISLLLALLASRQMTGPLRRLAQSAAAMEKGQLEVPIAVEGRDEVAQLAQALKRTAGALSESMATLESRVRERTRQLEEIRDREAALNRDLVAQNERLQAQGEQLRAQGEVLERQRGELVQKTRRGEEADRLKNAFIANMSHEIRTPLNSVLALSQLLRDGMAGALSSDQRKYLEVIERNGQNLLRLINDILDLSRIEAGHLEMDMQALDLGAQIRGAVGALLPLAEAKNLDLQIKVPDDLPLVRCDADRVRQVLTNLIGNAIKFTEAGHVQVSAEARKGMVAIHVTDTGVGIPEGAKGRVFQEFFQVDQTLARRRGGTGLGLAIASRLAGLMGGEISVESVLGSGSRFTFTLPQSAAGAVEGVAEVTGDAPTPLEGTILLVDDDEGELRRTSALLEGAGLQVVTVASGEAALAALAERSFDAVVIDLFMPGMSGFDVVREARKDSQLGNLPFIVLTAHDLTATDRESLGASAFGFVRKGETMRIGLLALIGKALKARGTAPLDAPLPPRDASILIVEDNEDNLFTLRQILGGLSIELAAAASGREAIDFCRRRRPDLIIMDMQMPGMSGMQATGAIRALPGGAAIPIIALTAQAMKGDRERILAAGCDEYLSKPIQPKVLLGVVRRLLSRQSEGGLGTASPHPHKDDQHGTHTSGR